MGFPGSSEGKASACNAGDLGLIPGSGRSLEKEMATHSSILAWKIPWMEEPGGLQGCKESDTTERLHSLTHPSNEGNWAICRGVDGPRVCHTE